MVGGLSSRPTIDGFEIRGVIGRGATGLVFEALQVAQGRRVAIKVLAEGLRADPSAVDRFRREGAAMARLEHPHIVPMLETGSANGIPYIAMRFVDGPTLRELIGHGDLDPAHVWRLLTGVASAIDFAHSRGVLHRDVKPRNILVEHGSHAWLGDFGLVHESEEVRALTSGQHLVGTVDYLAPEVAQGGLATPASDLYAFGVTAFFALTGALPFRSESHAATLFAHVTAPRPSASALDPRLPKSLDAALAKAMAVDPADRPGCAADIVAELGGILGMPDPIDRRRPTRERRSAGPPFREFEAQSLPSFATTSVANPEPEPPQNRRKLRFAAVAGSAGAAALAVVALIGSGSERGGTKKVASAWAETLGSPAHTWSDPRTAGGAAGPEINSHQTVRVVCRATGFRVEDGDRWWYRIGSTPWNGRFWVSADAAYNNGRSSGSLLRTPFVDRAVAMCGQER